MLGTRPRLTSEKSRYCTKLRPPKKSARAIYNHIARANYFYFSSASTSAQAETPFDLSSSSPPLSSPQACSALDLSSSSPPLSSPQACSAFDLSSSSPPLSSPQACSALDLSSSSPPLSSPQACSALDLSSSSPPLSSPPQASRSAPGAATVALSSSETEGMADQVKPVLIAKDRKSTRLNSSHVRISYAVFCLKKKKKNRT